MHSIDIYLHLADTPEGAVPISGGYSKKAWQKLLLDYPPVTFAGDGRSMRMRTALVAGAAVLLAACGAARPTGSAATPSPTSTPSATAAAFAASCKLPLTWRDTSTAVDSGGFLAFPGASFAPDSAASGLRTPFGNAGLTYDAPMARWVPAYREMLSPDGTTWVYGTLRGGNEYHAVNVSTGNDTMLWGSDKLYVVFGLDHADAYAMLDGPGGARVWRLPLDGSQGSQLKVTGIWRFVNGGKLWGTGSATLPAGAPYRLQQLDLKTNTVTSWLELDGPANLVGFDGSGSPIVEVGGPAGNVIVAPSPGVQRPVAGAFMFARPPTGYAPLPALGDEHGIWLPGADGVYVSIDGKATKQSSVQASPAGACR